MMRDYETMMMFEGNSKTPRILRMVDGFYGIMEFLSSDYWLLSLMLWAKRLFNFLLLSVWGEAMSFLHQLIYDIKFLKNVFLTNLTYRLQLPNRPKRCLSSSTHCTLRARAQAGLERARWSSASTSRMSTTTRPCSRPRRLRSWRVSPPRPSMVTTWQGSRWVSLVSVMCNVLGHACLSPSVTVCLIRGSFDDTNPKVSSFHHRNVSFTLI